MKRRLLLAASSLVFLATPSIGSDTDGDGVLDSEDNCMLVRNVLQVDTDGDLCGNSCDADYNDDGLVTFADFTQLGFAFGKSTDLEKDHTEPVTGPVGFADCTYFFINFGKVPGPSGTTSGTVACPIW